MARNGTVTSMVLSDDLAERVRAAANRETISMSAVVRRALLSYFFGPTMTAGNSYNHSQLPTDPEAIIDRDLAEVAG